MGTRWLPGQRELVDDSICFWRERKRWPLDQGRGCKLVEKLYALGFRKVQESAAVPLCARHRGTAAAKKKTKIGRKNM